MTAMVKLLTPTNFPEITPEDVTCEKIAVKTIFKEIHDADEPNFLEEEDMHVFDCRPLTDPLHLVCCNACKKPVRASQYAAHAEYCRTLTSTKDIALELEGGSGPKKPPRKGRKNSKTNNGTQRITSVEQEKSKSMNGIDVGGSELNFHQSSVLSSQSAEAQRKAASVECATRSDASEVGLRRTNHIAGPTASVDRATRIDHSEVGRRRTNHVAGTTASVNRATRIDSQVGHRRTNHIAGTAASVGRATRIDASEVGLRRTNHLAAMSDAPIPLATKVYYYRGSSRLRAELGRLYHEASANVHSSNSPELTEDNVVEDRSFRTHVQVFLEEGPYVIWT